MIPSILILLILAFGLAIGDGNDAKVFAQEANPKAFKALKEKMRNPQTGLPNTLDPGLFKGKAKKAYQVAKDIPEILAQMPCFCGCQAFGHENLLDCFIDTHGAG